ncbi:MAG: hypothetical protein ACTTKD_07400 [Peptoanaerobacter stomatis]|uniref:hypothetical protein n=1 Tax=Peptoanaerobacter stomatis TaxID=796937 RepID=UPI003FA14522
MIIKSKADLNAYLKSMVKHALQANEEVKDVIKKEMIEQIQTNVYDVYNPFYYERREQYGGMLDEDNIKIESVSDNTISIKEIAEFNGRPDTDLYNTLAERIEYGNPNAKHKRPYTKPRPFMEETFEELKENKKITKAFKKSLEDLGLKVKIKK